MSRVSELREMRDKIEEKLGISVDIVKDKLYISADNARNVSFQILIHVKNNRIEIYASNRFSIAIYSKAKWFRDTNHLIDILKQLFAIHSAEELAQV